MSKTRPARTLLEHCVARGGLLRGAKVAQFVVEWTICASDLGHQPNVSEFGRWWKDGSTRTTWRRIAAFQELFPEFDTPAPISEHLIAEARKRPIGEGLRESQMLGTRVVIA